MSENTWKINDIIRETRSVSAVQSASSMSYQNYFQKVIVKLRYSFYITGTTVIGIWFFLSTETNIKHTIACGMDRYEDIEKLETTKTKNLINNEYQTCQ